MEVVGLDDLRIARDWRRLAVKKREEADLYDRVALKYEMKVARQTLGESGEPRRAQGEG